MITSRLFAQPEIPIVITIRREAQSITFFRPRVSVNPPPTKLPIARPTPPSENTVSLSKVHKKILQQVLNWGYLVRRFVSLIKIKELTKPTRLNPMRKQFINALAQGELRSCKTLTHPFLDTAPNYYELCLTTCLSHTSWKSVTNVSFMNSSL